MLKFGVVLAGGLLVSAVALRPVEDVCASAIVTAPNAGKPGPSSTQPGELRVDVGGPSRPSRTAATLSVEIAGPASPRGTVFVLHGIRDSKASMRGWGEMLARAGYRAVLVDSRGHGRSTGDWLTYGVNESRDLAQVLDLLASRGQVAGEVGVMGISYGAATAIQWAGLDARVKAVIAVAPFASLRDVVPGYSPVPLPDAFLRRAIDLAGLRGGFDPDAASP